MKYKGIFSVLICCLLLSSIACAWSSSLTGKLSLIGNEPFTRLVCQNKTERYMLAGEYLHELKNLQGATVKLSGSKTKEKSPYEMFIFKVTNYELLYVGEGNSKLKPLIGYLELKEQQLYFKTMEHKTYLVKGATTEHLKEYPGMKMWIAGKIGWTWWDKWSITPEAFNVINPQK